MAVGIACQRGRSGNCRRTRLGYRSWHGPLEWKVVWRIDDRHGAALFASREHDAIHELAGGANDASSFDGHLAAGCVNNFDNGLEDTRRVFKAHETVGRDIVVELVNKGIGG